MMKDVIKRVIDLQGHDTLCLSFSCGADATACFLRIMEAGYDVSKMKLFYCSYGLMSWHLEYIEYFEKAFNVKIDVFINSMFMRSLAVGRYQSPLRRKVTLGSWDKDETIFIPAYKTDFIEKEFKHYYDLPLDKTYVGLGVKAADSALRRTAMNKIKGINSNKLKWYPIWDYSQKDVVNIIKKHNIKMPIDYKIWGISFKNIDYRFLKNLQLHCPNNFKKLCKIMPLLPTIITRHEYFKGTPPRKGHKLNKFDNILTPEKAL